MLDEAKRKTISELLGLYNHSLVDLAAYLKRVAPDMDMSAERKSHREMNGLLAALMEREQPPEKRTPIPYEENDRLGRDLWLFLHFAGVTLEDLGDFLTEETGRREKEVRGDMTMSNFLHALQGEAPGAVDLIERSEAIKKAAEGFDMDDFIRRLGGGTQ